MILGSANTSEKIKKILLQLNLTQSSLNLVEIPKKCKVLTFDNVFETCIKHYKMIVIAVYKRQEHDNSSSGQPSKENGNIGDPNMQQEHNRQREEQ